MADTIAHMILAAADMEITMMREQIVGSIRSDETSSDFMETRTDLKTLERWVLTRGSVQIWADTGRVPAFMMNDPDFQRWLEMSNENSGE